MFDIYRRSDLKNSHKIQPLAGTCIWMYEEIVLKAYDQVCCEHVAGETVMTQGDGTIR